MSNYKLWDYHVHSKYCRHANGNIEDYIKAAIAQELDEIGISEHNPYELMPESDLVPRKEYAMPMTELSQYFSELESLRGKYKEKIKVKIGMEIDYFAWNIENIKSFINSNKLKFDYIIGSVHILYDESVGYFPIDDKRFDVFDKVGVDKVFENYLDQMEGLINSGLYDIVAHIDLPKKNLHRHSNREFYLNRMENLLDIIKGKNLAIEYSLAGLRKKCKEPYPEEIIVEMIAERRIPMIISSDSHDPSDVGSGFKQAVKFLAEKGIKELVRFENRKQIKIPIKNISLD
ncbi:MAG: histidinol-phosphatase HisJ [Promethearchaeota archaeon]